ncbi:MAG: ABC transporter ATP-binding protein [Desulfurococcaceae archaeon]
MTLLNVENLKKYFPLKRFAFLGGGLYVRAVDDVSFTLNYAESVGIVGESGSGKTTLGYVVAGLEKPTSGRMTLDGIDITRKMPKALRGTVQIVFQDPRSSFDPRLKVLDSVVEPLMILGGTNLTKDEAIERAIELGRSIGLDEEQLNKYPHELSGGQIQRVAIARALITNPKLVVLDEPTSALDVSLRSQILNLLMKIKQQMRLTYLIISHDMFTISYMSERIMTMYAGKVVEEAVTDNILNKPLHPYTLALITSTPTPNPHLRNRKRLILQGDPPSLVNPPPGCRFHPRCPFATEKCSREEPPLVEIDRGHKVACYNIEKVEKGIA